MSGRRITPELTGSDDVQSAILTQDGSTVVASVIYDGPGHLGRGTIVGGIADLSARTGRRCAGCWPSARSTRRIRVTLAGSSGCATSQRLTRPAAICW